MKLVLTILGVPIAIFLVLSLVAASPLVGEVVTLHTRGPDGSWQTTPLWIVETGDTTYLRAGQPESSGWVTRIRADPEVRLERGEKLSDVRLVPDPDARDRVNELMAERYGWADAFVGLQRPVSAALPFRVEPVESVVE